MNRARDSENFPERKQEPAEGVGPLFHRKYRVAIPAGREAARATMRLLQADPNAFSPQLLARFEKRGGHPEKMAPGDCYQIKISGPWDGPVRVGEVTEESFVLHTLEGHLEAGEIHFRLEEEGDQLYFVIESEARSKDSLVDLVYDKIPVARMAQTTMWIYFAQMFAGATIRVERGEAERGFVAKVEVQTSKKEEGSARWEAA